MTWSGVQHNGLLKNWEGVGQEWVPPVYQHSVHGWCHRQEFDFCVHVIV